MVIQELISYPYVAVLFFSTEECSFPAHCQVVWESSLFVSIQLSSSDKWRTVPAFQFEHWIVFTLFEPDFLFVSILFSLLASSEERFD